MHSKVLSLVFILSVLVLNVTACASNVSSSEMQRSELEVDGNQRIYYFHAPKDRQSKAIPLVLVFHGGAGDGIKVSKQTAFNDVADRNGFAVVYPNSIEHWSDGRSTTGTSKNDTDFVLQLIDHLAKTENIDKQRVYATGPSNGGMFTLRLACELSDEIAAFAPVIASFPVPYRDKCKPSRPVPIMMINATKDTFIQWKGGSIKTGRRGAGGEVIPVPDTADFWRQHNRCSGVPKITDLPDVDKDDGTTVKVVNYPDCSDASAFEWVQIYGGGHAWPGTNYQQGRFITKLMGISSRDINASEMIWDFFKHYELPR
jgi:polyhydroxybutyrate depolymerase